MKQEVRAGYDLEEACMDTQLEGEEQEGEQGGEELDISFDSQFPDLMSELITEEAPPPADPPSAAPPASHASVFPMGVRYMVPPQPSPSSSFLPFPHPLPSSSSGLASITDFSPEWSYPEVTVSLWWSGTGPAGPQPSPTGPRVLDAGLSWLPPLKETRLVRGPRGTGLRSPRGQQGAALRSVCGVTVSLVCAGGCEGADHGTVESAVGSILLCL